MKSHPIPFHFIPSHPIPFHSIPFHFNIVINVVGKFVQTLFQTNVNYFTETIKCFNLVLPAERLSNVLVGVSNYFNGTIGRGSYPYCGQYPITTTVAGARLIIPCGEETPAGRYVIVQLPPATSSGTWILTLCELEVYGRGKLSFIGGNEF